MIAFRIKSDIHQLPPGHPFQRAIWNYLNKIRHSEGYFVLIEEGDTEINLPELKANIGALSFDGVFKVAGHYHAVYLTNNEFVIEFIIPDEEWISPQLKANLDQHLH